MKTQSRRRRALAVPVLLALLIGLVLVVVRSAGEPPVPSGPPVAEASTLRTAMSAARTQGTPVTVGALTSETRLVRAEPAGGFTAELSTTPARLMRQGKWVTIDTTLARRADGTVGTVATDPPLELSPGGAGVPLLRFGGPGRSMSLSWPGKLPAPRLSGSTATYPDVLPGVDLVVRADRGGYGQHLVVRNAAAAANRALRSIRLPLRTDGLTLRVTRDGGLTARDKAGAVVFAGPPAMMWDSTGARRSAVGVRVERRALVLTPDPEVLTGAGVRYPVTIDPTLADFQHTGWAKVFSGLPNARVWMGGIDGDQSKVGQCYPSPQCGGIGAVRTYYQFDTGWLAGKQITSANLQTVMNYSPDCATNVIHDLYHPGGDIGPDTTWNNAPQGGKVSENMIGTSCNGGLLYNFLMAPQEVEAGGVSAYFLKARDEGHGLAWRKYDTAATKLIVAYNTPPNAPEDLSTSPELPAACRWCDGKPYLGESAIRLQARLSDGDGDNLSPRWRILHNGNQVEERAGGEQTSGDWFVTDLDLSNRDGAEVSWGVRANDRSADGPQRMGPRSFVVDRVGVDRPPVVSGILYQADNRWHGSASTPDRFTFQAGGVADINGYLYGWTDSPNQWVDAESLGGRATVELTPPGDGPRILYVQSVDRAGHRSPMQTYRFYVRAGNGAVASWSLDGNLTDDAFLGDRHGTLTGPATYGPGAVGQALRLNGAAAGATAPNAIRTDAAFTVSAWAKLDSGGGAQAVVAQDFGPRSGFVLWYRPDNGGQWVFGAVRADLSATDMARSAEPAQLGVWTHLTGVYNPASNPQLRLYVNGVEAGSATTGGPIGNATGPVRIGHLMWNGALVDYWNGAVDEVELYDRPLSAPEVGALVRNDNVQLGRWTFDEQEGTTARNSVDGAESFVVKEGGSLVAGGAMRGSLKLDGVTGHAATSGAVVRTNRSFSVAAYVRLDQSRIATALSQDGITSSGFVLQQRNGAWVFELTDGAGKVLATAAGPAGTVQTGQWVHLAGVFDATTRKAFLYVDGSRLGADEDNAGPFADTTGALTVGRGRTAGSPADHWPGGIDEVRVYSRAIGADEVRGLLNADLKAAEFRLDGDARDARRTRPGSIVGALKWTAGRGTFPDPDDLAAQFDGPAHLTADRAVDTSRSFTVSAWARTDGTGAAQTIVSQDGGRVSSFLLQLTADGHWAAAMFARDADGGGAATRAVGAAAQPGIWTHVAASYSATDGRLVLYVNGVPSASVAHSGAWNAPAGLLAIGRGQWNGQPVDGFRGAVDDVTLYGRALFGDEVKTLAGRDLSLAHNWRLDEPSGGTAGDAVGTRGATLVSGASFAAGRTGNALSLDGSAGAARTNGVDVSTAGSFTVSAWVWLPDEEAKSCPFSSTVTSCRLDAVTQDGAATSKFRLGHYIDDGQKPWGAWIFEMPESDAPDAPVTKAAVSVEDSQVNAWVHLTGTYDAAGKVLHLYVDGGAVDDGTLLNAWPATGGLQIGRGRSGSTPVNHWRGKIDDVRLYNGVLTADRVEELVGSYGAENGTATLPIEDAGRWRLDEGGGTTAGDTSPNRRPLTLKGGAGWGNGRDGTAASFDGTKGYAETAGRAVDTSRDFTVSAWAVLNQGGGSANRVVLSQDGDTTSGFTVQYNPGTNTWAATVAGTDAADPATTTVVATEPAAPGFWTHLTLVHRAQTQQLRLYVNGVLKGAQAGAPVFNAGGSFAVGRAKVGGAAANFWPGVVDDVRAYGRALTDGEVAKVHDDVSPVLHGLFRFDDGTLDDASWRKLTGIPSGTGVALGPGVSGRAVRLDGAGEAVRTSAEAAPMRDSFTVGAWANLTKDGQIATVLAQDGSRMSGFVLQYRPAAQRWVFGVSTQDADGAPYVYASSAAPAQLNRWTHLAGVYDQAARQIRLYVDGQLAGMQRVDGVWLAGGGTSIGRSLVNGGRAEFFPGLVDEVRTDAGMLAPDEIARLATWPAPAAGQFGRYVSTDGDRAGGATSQAVPAGYHFDATLGLLLASAPAGSRLLYACSGGTDRFTSIDPACEGGTSLGEIGRVYASAPTGVATMPVYRCTTAGDRFESRDPCADPAQQVVLGHTLAYAPLNRYLGPGWDHASTTDALLPGYRLEGPLGVLPLTNQAGTVAVYACATGLDQFVSTDAACEGKRVVGAVGRVWTAAPPGPGSRALYSCSLRQERFLSVAADCQGSTVVGLLGYVLTTVPGDQPVTG
ncbi:LamG-like jellyroll fold domain-containing protein [Actinoplanes sp. NBRC 103695]|uniref:LamG-like jellyroll fold domain-containing protein n=1 Tax=Actinoplanes sp. NBRC 103695 TaxID=3032202 RepID=UPI0024A2EB2A|nr:LamG-like jellyroll fold domain-containing protein [Actinoplanes sp. NBRC 103695]GLZ00689.1 hypothetical protein Acsp02_79410 [Actinoplanes sp. NBRC 103695]